MIFQQHKALVMNCVRISAIRWMTMILRSKSARSQNAFLAYLGLSHYIKGNSPTLRFAVLQTILAERLVGWAVSKTLIAMKSNYKEWRNILWKPAPPTISLIISFPLPLSTNSQICCLCASLLACSKSAMLSVPTLYSKATILDQQEGEGRHTSCFDSLILSPTASFAPVARCPMDALLSLAASEWDISMVGCGSEAFWGRTRNRR